MGYTHYYYVAPEIPKDLFREYTQRVKTILKHPELDDLVCWEHDEPEKSPEVTSELVRFNGRGEDGHETFYFPRTSEKQEWDRGVQDPRVFHCTKTAHKPYDIVVMLCLLAAKETLKEHVRVSSDGDWEGDWTPAQAMYKRLFGNVPENLLDEPDPRGGS